MAQQFLCILFWDELQTSDLEFIVPSSADEPGQARLKQAKVGPVRPEAPNSRPLISASGANIGYVADISLLEPPHQNEFLL